MIKAIIFDCFGVLTADSWHEFRVGLPEEQQQTASDLNHRFCAGAITHDQFLAAVSELTGRSREFIHQLVDNETSKNLPLLEYIAELKERYKIGLLSNVASDFIRDRLLTEKELELFDAIVLSYEQKLTKPDPEMYRIAAQELEVRPEECVFIDDIERLAKASEAVGMKPLVYKDLKTLKAELMPILYSK